MIRHSVIFKLKVPIGSDDEKVFLDEVEKLRTINGVKNFECLRQISKKNNFDYGIFMEFDTMEGYDIYNKHPDHLSFVNKFWLKFVEDFLELDFERASN